MRRSARRESRRRWYIVSAAGLGTLAIAGAIVFFALRDDSTDVSATVKDGATAVSRSTAGTEGGPETQSEGPASRYAPARSELPGSFVVDVPQTFAQNISTFSSSYLFTNVQEGSTYAQQWKILDGFNVQYDPDGLYASVLKGGYYVNIETYLFEDNAGAKAAYDYMNGVLAKRPGVEKVVTKGMGNQSSAYELIQGTIPNTEKVQVYHRFIFRRGNVVANVMTSGAQEFMTIDKARDIAGIIDDRMLGKRQAIEPTPIPTPAINLPPTPAPSP